MNDIFTLQAEQCAQATLLAIHGTGTDTWSLQDRHRGCCLALQQMGDEPQTLLLLTAIMKKILDTTEDASLDEAMRQKYRKVLL